MRDPNIDRNLLMLMEADLLDDMGVLGLVMDAMIVRARKPEATFYDCYNHFEFYTHPQQHDCPVVTPEALAFWNEKTEALHGSLPARHSDRRRELPGLSLETARITRAIVTSSENYGGCHRNRHRLRSLLKEPARITPLRLEKRRKM